MILEMLHLWLGVAKAHFMWIVFVLLMGTIAWQHHSIGSLKEDVVDYQKQAALAQAEQADCERAYAETEQNYALLLEYYKARKPLEQKEGPVLPNIFDDLTGPKGQPTK